METLSQPKPVLRSRFLGELKNKLQGYIAATNGGKTTLMLNDAVDLALDGNRITYISLEMSMNHVIDRIISIAGIENEDVIAKNIDIRCLHLGDIGISYILGVLRNPNCDVVVIDYVSLLIKCHRDLSARDSILTSLTIIDTLAEDVGKPVITSIQMSQEGVYSKELSYKDETFSGIFNFTPVYNVDGILNIDGEKWKIEKQTGKIKKCEKSD